jgi:hypothetical protein
MEMARDDKRLAAGALVGSTASGGDRWSDIDITFSVVEGVPVTSVITDWTNRMRHEFNAVYLLDLPVQSTIYRVYLLPGNLQVDLSFTPQNDFAPRSPKFTLFFGNAKEAILPKPPSARELFGYAILYLLSARISIERGRYWQAEYLISGGRDYLLALACRVHGLKTAYGKGFDQLPSEITKPFVSTLVRSLDRNELLRALRITIDQLRINSKYAEDTSLGSLESQLHELQKDTLTEQNDVTET